MDREFSGGGGKVTAFHQEKAHLCCEAGVQADRPTVRAAR